MRKWDISRLSVDFQVRELRTADVPEILRLCQGNPLFYEHCPPAPTEAGIQEDMVKLPPRTQPEDKYFIGWFDSGNLIAVMDLIDGYPSEEGAFIGFFITDISRQGQGEGTKIIDGLCRFLESENKAFIRLGWVQGNGQSQHFWHKNGFQETGVLSRQEDYTIICAQRDLSHS